MNNQRKELYISSSFCTYEISLVDSQGPPTHFHRDKMWNVNSTGITRTYGLTITLITLKFSTDFNFEPFVIFNPLSYCWAH